MIEPTCAACGKPFEPGDEVRSYHAACDVDNPDELIAQLRAENAKLRLDNAQLEGELIELRSPL